MTKLTDEQRMQVRIMADWYRKIADYTKILDRMNTTEQPVFAAVNEGIRRMAKEAAGYIVEITDTQEMPAVVLPPVITYDADGKEVA